MFTLLLLLLAIVVTQSDASCDHIVTFDSNNVRAIVTVKPPPFYRQGDEFKLTLQLVLNDRTEDGSIRLRPATSSAATSLTSGLALRYYLQYPRSSSPEVKSVAINGHVICSENIRAFWRDTTSVSHTLYPAQKSPAVASDTIQDIISSRFAQQFVHNQGGIKFGGFSRPSFDSAWTHHRPRPELPSWSVGTNSLSERRISSVPDSWSLVKPLNDRRAALSVPDSWSLVKPLDDRRALHVPDSWYERRNDIRSPASYQQSRNDACDNYYLTKQSYSGVIGVVSAPPPPYRSPGDPVTTKVTFVQNSGRGGGKGPTAMELVDGLDAVGEKLSALSRDPIRYAITFKDQDNIPLISKILVNDREICSVGYPSQTVATYSRSYTVTPSGVALPPSSLMRLPTLTTQRPPYARPTYPTIYFKPSYHNSTLVKPTLAKSTFPKNELPILPNLGQCGKKVVKNNRDRLHGNVTVEPGDWPWLVGIYLKLEDFIPHFMCGGSLVTMKHVITAGHCLYLGQRRVTDDSLVQVALGMHHMSTFEDDAQIRTVERAIPHPGYDPDPLKNKRYEDIAVLVLRVAADYTARVQPVCAWSTVENNVLDGKQGTVAGWGMTAQSAVSETPRATVVPVVSRAVCRDSHEGFKQRISDKNFCAGNKDGVTGPCNGDSGGGMYFQERSSDGDMRWVVRGVVSFSVGDNNEVDSSEGEDADGLEVCDLNNYVGYVDVNKFAGWINGIIQI